MYMGVILLAHLRVVLPGGAPHVYGGDPHCLLGFHLLSQVLPMYMGVILEDQLMRKATESAPHVYGGDPCSVKSIDCATKCSPCIWG